jgi:nucleoside transporter
MRTRLAAMMFLQYAVQGLWTVPLAAFLMASPHEGGLNMSAGRVALIYATMSIGALVSPLVLGLLCDRLVAVQRMLAGLHFVGAGILWTSLYVVERYQEETALVFEKLAFVEPGGDNELWRLLWEKDSVEAFIADPEGYRRGYAAHWTNRFPWLWTLGYRFRQVHLDHPQVWGSPPTARERLAQLESLIEEPFARVRSDPQMIAAADRAFPPLFGLMLAYACVYLPTISLSNVVAFRNLPDPGRQFGKFRALGTLGWIAAGLFVGFAAPAVSPLCFLFAAVASALLAGLCLMLPHTPPIPIAPRDSRGTKYANALGLPALKMLADRSFFVYVLTALVATALISFHNIYTNKFLVDLHVEHPAAVQTLAQPTEIFGAMLIPWVWARLGTKWMLCLGLVASAARFAMYATGLPREVIGIGLPLHGLGFAFFYIAAYLYVDREAPPDLRASAQGLVTVLTLGIGGLVGNWIAGQVVETYTIAGVIDWRPVWLVPAIGTFAAAAFFAVFFQAERRLTTKDPKIGC